MAKRVGSAFSVIVVLLAACSGHASRRGTSQAGGPLLFDRLGGMDVIVAVVRDLVEHQLAGDVRINARFSSVDRPRFEDALATQLCELTGGPCKYTGKRMAEAHAGMAIVDTELDHFVEDLQRSLVKLEVGAREQRELLDLLAKLRAEIVGK